MRLFVKEEKRGKIFPSINFRGRHYAIQNDVIDGLPDNISDAEMQALLAHGFLQDETVAIVEAAAQQAMRDKEEQDRVQASAMEEMRRQQRGEPKPDLLTQMPDEAEKRSKK